MAIGSEIDSERIEYHRSTVLSVACCHDDQTVLSGELAVSYFVFFFIFV